MTSRRTDPFPCPRCAARMSVGAVSCAVCDHVLYSEQVLARARVCCEALVRERGEDPYLRSAGLLTYSMRSRVRGFLDDREHPFVAALLDHQRSLLELGGEGAWTQLLPYAERRWVEPDAPVLARALAALREARGQSM